MRTLAILLMLVVPIVSDPVWKPGRNCWVVYEVCSVLERHRTFVQHMTGPAGRLQILVSRGDRPGYLVDIKPNDVWLMIMLDHDKDGDLDLHDYALERVR